MKHGKKILSFVLSVVMILASLPFAGLVTVFAASIKTTDVTSGDLTFIVPEAIYLTPNASSYTNATTSTFQYYLNNNSDGSVVRSATDNTGKIYYTLSGGGTATISYEFLSTSLSGITGGSVTLSNTSISSGGTVTISGGSSPSLASGVSGCYIRWTLSFTENSI